MKTKIKFGNILVDKKLISKEQLRKTLSIQKLHPTKTIGEIVNKVYSIPESEIETVFIYEVIHPAIFSHIMSEIQKKVKAENGNIEELVPEMEISINRYRRKTISTREYSLNKNQISQPAEKKKFLSTIHCQIELLTLKTSFQESLVFKDIFLDYDIQSKKITLDNQALPIEAKLRLNQLIKRQSGIAA